MVEYHKLVSKKYGKAYVAIIFLKALPPGHTLRRFFKTATDALKYGRRVQVRYGKLLKAAK